MDREKQDKIFSYLIVSARGCVDEPHLYGPLRLLDACVLLIQLVDPEELDPFYIQLGEKIDSFRHQCMHSEKEFVKELNNVVELITDHVINH